MPGKHAACAPSGADGWMTCAHWTSNPESSKYADEGSDAHSLAADVLDTCGAPGGPRTAADFIGTTYGEGTLVDEDMAAHIQGYVNRCLSLGRDYMVEQRLPLDDVTGEPESYGTSDFITFEGDELIVCDLKYGMGIRVDAEENKQLQIYALAALRHFAPFGPFRVVRLIIDQPRLNHVSEWVVSVEKLQEFAIQVRLAAKLKLEVMEFERVANATGYTPSEKGCRWCVHKPNCAALAKHVQDTIGAQFDVLGDPEIVLGDSGTLSPATLAEKMAAVDLIEDWCKAVRAEVERRLLVGDLVEGWKLVLGRKSARKWEDEAAAEAALKALRLKKGQMYTFDVKSPTQIEKVLKEKPRQWAKVQGLIAPQGEPSKSVAPASDTRPAIVVKPIAEQFEDIEG